MQKNDLVASNRKVAVSASDLDQLTGEVAAALELEYEGSEYLLSNAVADPSEAVAITDFDSLKAKAKLQIWLRSHFEAEPEEAEVVEGVETDAREFTILMQKNDLVASNRKVACSASDLDQLVDEIAAAVELEYEGSEYIITLPVDDPAEAIPIQEFDEVKSKAKLQVWPRSHFEEEEEAEADPHAAEFTILMQKNELVASNRKVTAVFAANLDQLVDEIAAALELEYEGSEYMISNAVADSSEAVAIVDFNELKPKLKLQIWSRSHFEEVEEAEAEAEEVPEAVPPTPGAEEAKDAREFNLLMQKNELVPSNRKLTLSAASLEDLTEQVCSAFELVPTSNYCLATAASDAALGSLDELGAKAKLQVWPATRFDAEPAAEEPAEEDEQELTEAEQDAVHVQTAEDALAEKLAQAEMMMEYDRKAASAVSLTNTAAMSVSVVVTDDQEIFQLWVQQGEDSWKMEKQWSDCIALQEALAEQAKMMGVKVPKLGGFSIGMRKKAAVVSAERKKSLEAYLKAAVADLSMTSELNVFLERGMHHGNESEGTGHGVGSVSEPVPTEPVPTEAAAAEEPEVAAAAEEPAEELLGEARDITLLIKPNELVPSTRRMTVSVRSFAELLSTVGTDLGLGDGIALSSEDETVQLTSLDQFGKKEKVMVWFTSKFDGFAVEAAAVTDEPAAEVEEAAAGGGDGPPIGDVEGTAWTINFDEEDGYFYYNTDTEESLWDMPDEVAAALGWDAGDGGGEPEGREIALLMAKNEMLPSNRKLAVIASSLESLTAEVCAGLGQEPASDYVLAAAGADAALASFDDVGAKAKLQLWPVGHF